MSAIFSDNSNYAYVIEMFFVIRSDWFDLQNNIRVGDIFVIIIKHILICAIFNQISEMVHFDTLLLNWGWGSKCIVEKHAVICS